MILILKLKMVLMLYHLFLPTFLMINYTPYTRMYKWEIFPQHVPHPKFYYHMFITTFSYLCQNKAIQNKKELLTLNWYHDIDAKTKYCAWHATLRVSQASWASCHSKKEKVAKKLSVHSSTEMHLFHQQFINRYHFSLMK